MLAKKILKNLENGNYRVEYRERCDCEFYWYLKDGEYVCDTVSNGGCWFGNALIMDDLAGQCDDKLIVGSDGVIATYNVYYGVIIKIVCWNSVIFNKILRLILDSDVSFRIRIGVNIFRTKNELHEKRRDKALIDYFCS